MSCRAPHSVPGAARRGLAWPWGRARTTGTGHAPGERPPPALPRSQVLTHRGAARRGPGGASRGLGGLGRGPAGGGRELLAWAGGCPGARPPLGGNLPRERQGREPRLLRPEAPPRRLFCRGGFRHLSPPPCPSPSAPPLGCLPTARGASPPGPELTLARALVLSYSHLVQTRTLRPEAASNSLRASLGASGRAGPQSGPLPQTQGPRGPPAAALRRVRAGTRECCRGLGGGRSGGLGCSRGRGQPSSDTRGLQWDPGPASVRLDSPQQEHRGGCQPLPFQLRGGGPSWTCCSPSPAPPQVTHW